MRAAVGVDAKDIRTVFAEHDDLLWCDDKLVQVRQIHQAWKAVRGAARADRIGKRALLHELDMRLVDRFVLGVVRRELADAGLAGASVLRLHGGRVEDGGALHDPGAAPIRKCARLRSCVLRRGDRRCQA